MRKRENEEKGKKKKKKEKEKEKEKRKNNKSKDHSKKKKKKKKKKQTRQHSARRRDIQESNLLLSPSSLQNGVINIGFLHKVVGDHPFVAQELGHVVPHAIRHDDDHGLVFLQVSLL